jgi:hypothetical protein
MNGVHPRNWKLCGQEGNRSTHANNSDTKWIARLQFDPAEPLSDKLDVDLFNLAREVIG